MAGRGTVRQTVKFLAFFRAGQARCRLAQRPRFASPATLTCLEPRSKKMLERHPHEPLQVTPAVGHTITVSAMGSLFKLASMIRKMVIQMTVQCVTMDEDTFCLSNSCWQTALGQHITKVLDDAMWFRSQ